MGTLGKAAQIFACVLVMLILATIAHKGHSDISRIADKHSGKEFWVEVARYMINNMAGGGKKQQ